MPNQGPPQPLQHAQEPGTVGSDSMSVNLTSPYLTFTRVGTHWHGRRPLNNVIVFGDSYSSRMNRSRTPETDEDRPYRLSRLWRRKTDKDRLYDTIGDDATWIDFFASTLSAHGSVVVKNFARPGHFLGHHLDGQPAQFFEQSAENMEPGEATFVFFLGINDCGGMLEEDLSPLIDVLIDAVRQLYVCAAARNFVLVDVPPTDRSPAGKSSGHPTTLVKRIETWNETLVTHAAKFASENAEATVLVFSSHKVLSEILDEPGAHGFTEDAKDAIGGGIWRDRLHLTPAVHEIFARRVSRALGSD